MFQACVCKPNVQQQRRGARAVPQKLTIFHIIHAVSARFRFTTPWWPVAGIALNT